MLELAAVQHLPRPPQEIKLPSFWPRRTIPRKKNPQAGDRWYRALIQRRVSAFDHLRPQRWNWDALVKPLDQRLERRAERPLSSQNLAGLRYFWLDGLFSATSETFFLGFIALFALAYGASNSQIGLVTAAANLLGAISLFPGARAVERFGRRKPVVLWSAGGIGRLTLLGLACLPFVIHQPALAIWTIIGLNGVRAFMGNFGNPAWTAMVADLVPDSMRGRYFSSRNVAMGLAALVVAPLAGWIINFGSGRFGLALLGYQSIFFLAFVFGLLSTLSFARIPEPAPTLQGAPKHQRGDLRRALKKSPGFLGLVASAFIWNMALQIAAPFFNVYLVSGLGASALMVGITTGTSNLTALVGQVLFGRLLDKRSTIWVLRATGLLIPGLPLAWIIVTEPYQVIFINIFGGMLWAGYNLANFNLLLEMSPQEQRPRAVALYQTAVFTSAVAGPLLGGYLADLVGFKLIFGLSGIGRFAGTLIFLWFAARPALSARK